MSEERHGLGWSPIVLALLLAAGVGYAGNYHFMYGSQWSPQKLAKVSWSLSETVINVDEVAHLPLIVARARYPLFLQAWERAKE